MNEIKVLGNLPKMNKDKKLVCKLRRHSFRNLKEKRTNKKIKGWKGGETGWLNWWSSSCISPVSSEAWLPPCMTCLCVYNVCLRYCFFEAFVCVCVCVCVCMCTCVFTFTEQKSHLPGSRQAASLPSFRTLSAKIPCLSAAVSLSLCLSVSLSLTLSLGWTRPPLAIRVWSFWRWLSLECLGPPRASSVSFASVAGVASLLCANSALIQKLFYAVKGTCDRQRGVEGRRGVGKGRGGGKATLFSYLSPWPQSKPFHGLSTWPAAR